MWTIGYLPDCIADDSHHRHYPFQLLEYQTDVRSCRFDTLGKFTPAHCAGALIARERTVC